MSLSYQANIISPCCNHFTINGTDYVFCSKCGKQLTNINESNMIVDMKYNTNCKNNTNNVYNVNLWHDARNWADDETLRLINIKCKECDSYCRFARDLTNEHIYICSNINCRCVYNSYLERIDTKTV